MVWLVRCVSIFVGWLVGGTHRLVDGVEFIGLGSVGGFHMASCVLGVVVLFGVVMVWFLGSCRGWVPLVFGVGVGAVG